MFLAIARKNIPVFSSEGSLVMCYIGALTLGVLLKGQVRPNGTLMLLIVLFFKNTMLFTGSQTDVVRRRYSSGCKGFQKNAWIGVLPWS